MDVLQGFPKVFTFFRYCAQWDFFLALKGKILIYAVSFKMVNSCSHTTIVAKGVKKHLSLHLCPRCVNAVMWK